MIKFIYFCINLSYNIYDKNILKGDDKMPNKRVNRILNGDDKPQYIKLYLQDILYLSNLPKNHEKILFELLKRTTYAGEKYGMEVVLNASIKKRIAETLGIKNIRSINNALSDLVKGKILFRTDTGLYTLNPHLFGKRDWQDISKLRLTIDYDATISDRTFKIYYEYKSKDEQAKEKMQQEIPLFSPSEEAF